MKRFAELLDRLGYEPGRNNKLRLMTEYFRSEHVAFGHYIELGSMDAIKELVKIGVGVGVPGGSFGGRLSSPRFRSKRKKCNVDASCLGRPGRRRIAAGLARRGFVS